MAITIDYAQPLRAIGQALEILKMESFELEPGGEDFVVRGKVTVRGGGADVESTESRNLRFSWEGERNLEAADLEPEATPPIVNRLDLCYTLRDVDRLEQKGQARRGETPGVTKAPGLSHLLRAIGAYLDEKPARLLKIAKDGESVTVVYETFSGVRFEERRTVADVDDLQMQLSMKRGKRKLQ